MKKTILKRTADILEKIGVASIAVGLFQNNIMGIWLSPIFFIASYAFTIWEAKK